MRGNDEVVLPSTAASGSNRRRISFPARHHSATKPRDIVAVLSHFKSGDDCGRSSPYNRGMPQTIPVPRLFEDADNPEEPSTHRVMLKSGRRQFFFVPDQIDWVEAAGNYSEVHARGETFLVREVLGSLERRLQRFGFARIDRSILVNTRRVFEIRKTGRRVYVAVLEDGTQLRLAPSSREELERLLTT